MSENNTSKHHSNMSAGHFRVDKSLTFDKFNGVYIGKRAKVTAARGIAIGEDANATAAGAIQLGAGTNPLESSFKTYGLRTTYPAYAVAVAGEATVNGWCGFITNDSALAANTPQTLIVLNNLVSIASSVVATVQCGAGEEAQVNITDKQIGTFELSLLSIAGTAAAPIVHFIVVG